MATTQTLKKGQTKERTQPTEDLPEPLDSKEIVAQTDDLLEQIDEILEASRIEFGISDPKTERPYTLADAIREGSLVTDQAIGAWTTPKGETCALSAAYLACKAKGLV